MNFHARRDHPGTACDHGLMKHRRKGALVGATLLLTLAACGSGSDEAAPPVTDQVPAATDAPAGDGVTEAEATETEAPVTDAPATEAAATDAPEPEEEAEQPVDTDATADEAPAEPVATDAPEAVAPAAPVVGGRLFASEVQPAAQFDSNPFPDLVVDDIGKDVKVNVANILPSDRPVLLWAWAPH